MVEDEEQRNIEDFSSGDEISDEEIGDEECDNFDEEFYDSVDENSSGSGNSLTNESPFKLFGKKKYECARKPPPMVKKSLKIHIACVIGELSIIVNPDSLCIWTEFKQGLM